MKRVRVAAVLKSKYPWSMFLQEVRAGRIPGMKNLLKKSNNAHKGEALLIPSKTDNGDDYRTFRDAYKEYKQSLNLPQKSEKVKTLRTKKTKKV